jgi:hypothetical protein
VPYEALLLLLDVSNFSLPDPTSSNCLLALNNELNEMKKEWSVKNLIVYLEKLWEDKSYSSDTDIVLAPIVNQLYNRGIIIYRLDMTDLVTMSNTSKEVIDKFGLENYEEEVLTKQTEFEKQTILLYFNQHFDRLKRPKFQVGEKVSAAWVSGDKEKYGAIIREISGTYLGEDYNKNNNKNKNKNIIIKKIYHTLNH